MDKLEYDFGHDDSQKWMKILKWLDTSVSLFFCFYNTILIMQLNVMLRSSAVVGNLAIFPCCTGLI